jgi:phosphate transport system permease protein|tara:strand:- start:3948 stop:4868 length:921 start_codon:yes stop_codon:yes gene_type:complete
MQKGFTDSTWFIGASKKSDKITYVIFLSCALLTILTTIGIVTILLVEGLQFFREISVIEFFTESRWTPLFPSAHFGIAPLLVGTMLIAFGAAFVCVPLGTLTAIFLAELAPDKVRALMKPILEVLAGIPTVVYGYFALTFISPILQNNISEEIELFNALAGMIVVGIMTLPMVCSISDDAINAVPASLREASYGLGATKYETITKITVPAALSGIVASYILAFSRAVGETMAVTIAAGAMPNLTLNPLEGVQTMTAFIVQLSLGDTPHGTIEFKSIFAVAMTLFLLTLIMNVISTLIIEKFKEQYE